MGGRGRGSRSGAIFGGRWFGPMAPRPLSPLVLALGGAAAVLGSVLFVLWKSYFGRGRERRWDRGEGWWGAEPARLPEWDEWDVSAGPGVSARATGAPGSGAWGRRPSAPGGQPGRRDLWIRGMGGLWALGGGFPAGGVGARRLRSARGPGRSGGPRPAPRAGGPVDPGGGVRNSPRPLREPAERGCGFGIPRGTRVPLHQAVLACP